MAINKNKVQLQETVLDSNGHPLSSTDVNPLTSSDCVIMENGMTLEDVMGNDTVIDTPTIMNEDTSFKVGIGDSETKVIDSDVAKMVIEGKTYQNILPKPTTLIMNTDEKEFKINDKIDSSIVLDDNVAEIATVKGQTYVNVVQEESASEYVAIDEELNGQSITITGKPEGYVKNATLEGLTLVNTIQEPSGADATVLELDADIDAQSATIDNTVQGGIHGAILKGQTLVNLIDFSKFLNTSSANKDGNTITITSTSNNTWFNLSLQLNGISYGKTYIACWDSLTYTHQASQGLSQLVGVYSYDANGNQITVKATAENQTTNYLIFTLPSNADPSKSTHFRVHATTFTEGEGSTTTIKGVKVLEYQEGMENWDIPYFEGMQSVEVPSVTTVGKNLFDGELIIGKIEDNGKPNTYVSTMCMSANYMRVQPNTTYNYKWSQERNNSRVFFYDVNKNFIKKDEIIPPTGSQFTTPSNCYYILFHIAQNTGMDSYTVLITKSNDLTYEPYKSSTLTTDKNLFDGILAPDYLTDTTGQPSGRGDGTAHCHTPSFIPIQANEKFRLKATSDGSTTVGDGRVYFYDKDYNYLNIYVTSLEVYTNTFSMDVIHTVPNNSNIAYMRVRFFNGLGVQADSVQINKVIELRKVGNVQDELDLETGKLTQRIGEVVLDGSGNWKTDINGAGVRRYFLEGVGSDLSDNISNSSSLLCDKFKASTNIWTETNDGIQIVKSNGIFFIDSSVDSLGAFVNKLKTTNIKVQYSLIEKSIKTVDLTIQDQDNNPIKSIQTHPTLTHITTSSQGLIPNIVIPSQLKYPTIIKPSTTYTVQLKQTTVNSEFPLTINLGGTVMAVPSTKFTITTPETLTSQDVIFTGKNNVIGEVVITEGDTTGIEYDFFEGINDVKSPKMYATGKNLCYLELGYINSDYGTDSESPGSVRTNYVRIDPTKRYVITGLNKEASSFVAFYDTNKNFISRLPGTKREYIVLSKSSFTPSETRYVRVTNYGADVSLDTPILFEKIDEGNTSYEPYKGVTIEQDIDSIPLTSDMFEQGYYDYDKIIKGMSMQQTPLATDSHYIERRIYSKSLIKVKPNSKYKVVGGLYGWFLFFDKNGNNTMKRVGSLNQVITNEFTTDSNTYYVGMVLHKQNNGVVITPSDIPSDLALQEVTDEIVLRSIGDVKDTLNLTTGEYVQRIGEVVFDGSEEWTQNGNGSYGFFTTIQNSKPSSTIVCDKLKEITGWNDYSEKGIFRGTQAFGIVVTSNELTTCNVETFKTWLSQNPIKVQYELTTPIIHKVNLTNTTKLPSYASTTHYDTIVPSNSLIPNITIPSTLNYNVAIKPSTQYTIRANTTSAMSVNLGGSTGTLANGKVTLTTPSTLAHNSLKLGNGKAKEVMVVEGSEIKDNVPFFNGMKNVQMGGIKLVNIARYKSHANGVSVDTNKTVFTYTSVSSTGSWGNIEFDKSLLKTNTVYTVYLNVVTNNSDRSDAIKISLGNDNDEWIDIPNTFTGIFKTTFKTNDIKDQFFGIYFRNPSTSGQQVVIQNPMIIEGDWTHLDEIPFIESEMIIEQPIIRSQGKNLINIPKGVINEWNGATIATNDDGTITLSPNSDNQAAMSYSFYFEQPIKVKTGIDYTYTIERVSGGNNDFSGAINARLKVRKKDGTITDLSINDITSARFNKTINKYTFDQDVDGIIGIVPIMYAVRNLTSPIIIRCQLEEGSTDTSYEPFKQHTLSSNRVIGYEENCYYAIGGGAKLPTDTINSVMADVEGLSVAYVTGGSSNYTFWDKDNVFISGKQYLDTSLSSYDKNGFIQVPSNAKYMRFAAGNDKNAQNLYRIATVTGELPLRSLPNGVCDSFNLVTGEYVQRVGEVVLDGINIKPKWIVQSVTNNITSYFDFEKVFVGAKTGSYAFSHKFIYESYLYDDDRTRYNEGIYIGSEGWGSVRIFNSRLETPDYNGFVKWLQQNPITVQYELETPIVRKIGLTAKGNYKEITLDGSENWISANADANNTICTRYYIPSGVSINSVAPNMIVNSPTFSDYIKSRKYQSDSHGQYEYVSVINEGLYLQIYKNKLLQDSVSEFKQWLSQHPMKVGYLTNQSNTTYSNILKPIFFNNVKVQFMNDNVDIQPSLTLQARSMNSYVLDNIKPSTQYTSKFWHSSYTTIRVKIDNNYFNISNNTTFNSPSTLTNKLLVVAEGMQEFMIIEGDVIGKQLPYYKGIRSSFDNTDEIEIYSVGKNLFDMNKLTYSTEITYRDVNKIIFNTSGTWEGLAYDMQLKPNTKYILSCIKNKTSIKQFYRLYNGSSYSSSGEGGGNTVTFTTNNTGKVRITYEDSIGNTTDNEVSNIMLVEGTVATPYQPHKENSTIINMPMQLETVEVVKPVIEVGTIQLQDGQNYDNTNDRRSKDYIPVQPGMTLAFMNGNEYRAENVYLYGINKNYISAVYTNGSGDLTIPNNCYFIRFYSSSANTSDISVVKQQYKPIALNSLPNGVKDELIINRATSSAKLIRRVGKVVLDGFSDGHDETVAQFNFRKFVIYTGLTSIKVAGQCVTSDNLPCIVDGEVRNTIRLAVDGKIVINIDGFSSINEYFNYLKQNPLTVYYELAEPVITEIRLKGYPFVYKDGSITLNTDIAPVTRTSYNVNQHQLINSQNETIIRHDKQISDLYDYIEIYLDEIYRMELFKMQLELSL